MLSSVGEAGSEGDADEFVVVEFLDGEFLVTGDGSAVLLLHELRPPTKMIKDTTKDAGRLIS